MDNQLLVSRVNKYQFLSKEKQKQKPLSRRQAKKRNKRLKWVEVSSPEFKQFVKSLKLNYSLTQKDQACTICWGRVPLTKKQKHMEHCKYIIDAEFFKDARAFLKLWKSHNMIDDTKVALLEDEVPDTVYEYERDDSNANQRFFANDISAQRRRNILDPVKHSTLLRTDVASERIINENENVKYYYATKVEEIKESLVRNDQILQKIVGKFKSIMEKNDLQKKKLLSMENSWLHIHSSIESKSMLQENIDMDALKKIDEARSQTKPKDPYRDFGVVYDTEDKQFMHKRKVLLREV